MYVYIYIYTHTPIAYYLPGLDRRALIAAAFLVGCDYDAGSDDAKLHHFFIRFDAVAELEGEHCGFGQRAVVDGEPS